MLREGARPSGGSSPGSGVREGRGLLASRGRSGRQCARLWLRAVRPPLAQVGLQLGRRELASHTDVSGSKKLGAPPRPGLLLCNGDI